MARTPAPSCIPTGVRQATSPSPGDASRSPGLPACRSLSSSTSTAAMRETPAGKRSIASAALPRRRTRRASPSWLCAVGSAHARPPSFPAGTAGPRTGRRRTPSVTSWKGALDEAHRRTHSNTQYVLGFSNRRVLRRTARDARSADGRRLRGRARGPRRTGPRPEGQAADAPPVVRPGVRAVEHGPPGPRADAEDWAHDSYAHEGGHDLNDTDIDAALAFFTRAHESMPARSAPSSSPATAPRAGSGDGPVGERAGPRPRPASPDDPAPPARMRCPDPPAAIPSPPTMPDDDIKTELERLRAENERLKQQLQPRRPRRGLREGRRLRLRPRALPGDALQGAVGRSSSTWPTRSRAFIKENESPPEDEGRRVGPRHGRCYRLAGR